MPTWSKWAAVRSSPHNDEAQAETWRRLGQRRITDMNGIDVLLFCPAQHHVGNLVKNATQIGYHPPGGQLATWPPHQADMWWEVSCPDGCPGSFGGAVDPIRQEVDRLAADPKRTTAHYTLKRVG